MIHVIATIELAPGTRNAYLAVFRKLIPDVRAVRSGQSDESWLRQGCFRGEMGRPRRTQGEVGLTAHAGVPHQRQGVHAVPGNCSSLTRRNERA